jgi:hypothetical protein
VIDQIKNDYPRSKEGDPDADNDSQMHWSYISKFDALSLLCGNYSPVKPASDNSTTLKNLAWFLSVL